MTRYIQFDTTTSHPILVEVSETEVAPVRGVVKAGLQERVQQAALASIDAAQTTFEHAMQQVLDQHARVFSEAVQRLPIVPAEAEVTFTVKATGEVSNIAVGKLGADANYHVRLVWRTPATDDLAARTTD